MLGLCHRSLINEPVEAWRYGPVIPSVYQRYRSFRSEPIEIEVIDRAELFDKEQIEVIDDVLEAYQAYSAFDLSNITHRKGTPWSRVFEDGRGLGAIIPNRLIEEYFIKQATSTE